MVAIYPSEIVQAETGYSDPKLRREAPPGFTADVYSHMHLNQAIGK